MIRVAVSLPLLLAAGATTAAAPPQNSAGARIERTLAGLTPGTPKRCLARDKVNELRTAKGVIVFVAGRDRVWRNDVVGKGCIGLARGDTVVTETMSDSYCRGDFVRTRSPAGGAIGSCSLGDFVPYSRAARQ